MLTAALTFVQSGMQVGGPDQEINTLDCPIRSGNDTFLLAHPAAARAL